ncbi:ABC transporter substrate-binding protein [Pseudoalteromonas sp. P1-8]|uniref:ABC transporter substrate-binding protein n=1 Tax=Pseudoalteromonas sp. P1-8 TaxID=1710353 RepID=UPI0006DC1A14|nr:ABC transporter substrate-binding protein [Pseudoalteromonas sp. P1-8]KPW00401.1 D-allose transporter subunit [Pseudoalteromonas sp. P1-8]
MRVCLLVFTLLCCSPLYAGEQFSVLLVNPSVKSDVFWQKVTDVMQVAAKQNNVSLTTIYGGGNRHIQLAELKQYLQYNPKPDYAILINYPGGAEQSMSLLEQHKVNFITLEETIVGVERDEVGKPRQRFKYWLGEVFHDNFKAGEQLGKALLEEAINTKQTPHFVAINGHYGTESDTRSDGLVHYLRKQDVELEQVVYASWNKQEAENKVSRLLQRYPDTNVIWCASDLMAQGALEAVKGKKDKAYFIGGIDWLDDNLDLIEQQKLTASVGGHFMMGAWALISVIDHHNGNPYWQNHDAIKFQLGVITKHNIQSYSWLRNIKDWSVIPFETFLLQNSKSTEYAFDFDTLHSLLSEKPKNAALH